ncbi:MAG: LysR family transcriptional regulator [Rhodospirillales bacterium]|jgi:DNA-binding transcriptional LysR family regulator|nr:LysR family transcriptional regulator [Rhodospirillales bacterium]
MNEPFEEMAIFARIAEQGSFTAAAKSLGRSKAYVSQQLTKLEERLGIQLLFRTTRKLSLTEAGKVYLDYCQAIVKSATEARQSIAALQGEMTGSICLSTTSSFGEIMVSEVLSRFQEKYPEVQIDLDLSDEIKDLQAEGIDMTIRGGEVVDENLVAIPLVQWRMFVVATPEYLATHGTPQTPDDLKDHNCIGTKHETTNTGWPFMINGEIKRIKVDGNFTVNRNPMIKKSTLQGKGLAWLPSYVAYREIQSGELVRVLSDYDAPAFTFFLTYVYQKAIPFRNRRLIDFIKEWFEKPDMAGLH